MRAVAWDSETVRFRPGVMAPEMACITWQVPGGVAEIAHWREAEEILHTWLSDPDVLHVGANTAFDMSVAGANFPRLVDLIFKAYREDRVTDVLLREKLLDIAAGRYQGYHTPDGGWLKPKYSLGDVARRYGLYLDKPAKVKGPSGKMIDDPTHPRLRFGEVRDLPVDQWPHNFVQYAKEDAIATLVAYEAQEKHESFLGEQYNQIRVALARGLASTWGLRTNGDAVRELVRKAEVERERVRQRLEDCGLVRPNGVRDTKAARAWMVTACKAQGIAVPLTKTGLDPEKTAGLSEAEIEIEYASLAEDACDATGDVVLEDYADFGRLGSVVSKDGPALEKGTRHPIHTRFDLAATLRGTSSKPNMQNWGRGIGPRECFVARPGKVYIQADYPQVELRGLAQTCLDLFGFSRLAEILNAGKDPHSTMAATLMGQTYDWVLKHKKRDDVDKARQTGKVFNFGKPGGLGVKNFVKFAKKQYDVTISEADAKDQTKVWLATFPEMRLFFQYVGKLVDNEEGLAAFLIPGTTQTRGGAAYCAACNTHFQGISAVAAGRGLWLVCDACYTDRKSPLFGTRPVNQIHDEIIAETDDNPNAHDAAWELARLMDVGANEYFPDVPIHTDPVLMRYWSKDAFALERDGRLVPWAGEWACDECKGIFMPPAPPPVEGKQTRVCAAHTVPWV